MVATHIVHMAMESIIQTIVHTSDRTTATSSDVVRSASRHEVTKD